MTKPDFIDISLTSFQEVAMLIGGIFVGFVLAILFGFISIESIVMFLLNAQRSILFKWLLNINDLFLKDKKYFSANRRNVLIRSIVDLQNLHKFLESFKDGFVPHKIDMDSLKSVGKLKSHIMLGVFKEEKLIGYGLIRIFPIIASYATFISADYRGLGLGKELLSRQMEAIKEIHRYPLSLVSKENIKSIGMLNSVGIKFIVNLKNYALVGGKK